MREIKFRGYAVEEMVNSQWLEGFGVLEFKFDEYYAKEVGRDSDCWIYTSSGDYRVDPKSIGQYTGLKDKNGKEIYEGDILECRHKTKGNVFFHDGSFRLSSDQCELNLEDIHSYDDLNQYLIEDNDLVVLGNIYENPELMEDSK